MRKKTTMIKIERYLKLQMLRKNYEGAGIHLPDDTSQRHGGETCPGGFKGKQLKMAMTMTMTMTIFLDLEPKNLSLLQVKLWLWGDHGYDNDSTRENINRK